jgi:hypothetical protein
MTRKAPRSAPLLTNGAPTPRNGPPVTAVIRRSAAQELVRRVDCEVAPATGLEGALAARAHDEASERQVTDRESKEKPCGTRLD